MARHGRKLDVEHVEALISERELAITEIARKMARYRARRTPTEKEVDKDRRNIQRWIAGGGVEDRGLQLFARALGERPESLVLPAEPPLDPASFSRSLLGYVVELLEQEPEMMRTQYPDLLLGLAAELRRLAERLEAAAAANGRSGEQPRG